MAFIREYFLQFGISPSFGEIGRAIAMPSSKVGELLDQMERNKWLARVKGVPRSITLPSPADQLSNAEILMVLKSRGFVVWPPNTRADEVL
jgi:SOS-response transcriptional repressor LexA